MILHPLDGSQTPEDEDRAERAAIIEEGNPGMTRAEAERLCMVPGCSGKGRVHTAPLLKLVDKSNK